MCRSRVLPATVGIACVLGLGAAVLAAAPQQPQPPAPQTQTAQQRFKNVQVLKDIPAAQMNPTMHLMAGQLGVGCTFCHVWEQWEREDKPQKQIARAMIAMTSAINRSSFGGAQMVTCYTCHRGQPKPVTMVALPVPAPPHWEAPEPALPVLPDVDEILSKYVRALGGEQALRKVTSRVITGRRDIPTGPGGLIPMPAEVEIFQKAPNRTLSVYRTDTFTISDGFDGTTAWTQTAAGAVNTLPDPDQGRVRRSANFYEPLELTQDFVRMEVRAIEKVGARDAHVVVGYPEGDTPERLYFDTQSGLLLRRAAYLQTPAGPSPFEVDFDDYRDAGGVRFPFLVRMNPASQRTELGTSSTLRIDSVRTNVIIDDSRFVRPQPRPRPSAPAAQ
jgi:hypothetical protein